MQLPHGPELITVPPAPQITVSAAAHPFRAEVTRLELPAGPTLADMLALAQPDPVLRAHAHIFIDGHLIDSRYWHRVRPKPGREITIRVVPAGGDGGSKSIIRTIGILVITVVAAIFGQYYVGPLLASAAGATGAAASAIAAGTGIAFAIGAGLIANQLFPIRPASLAAATASRDSPTYFIEGARNDLRPFRPVPVVLGRHRQVPPYGARAFTEAMGIKQYVRCLFVWGVGPIDISDVRIGDTPIEEFDEVEIETRQGYATDAPVTLFSNDVSQEDLSIQLTQAAGWISRTTATDADEIGIDISLPQGHFWVAGDGKRYLNTTEIQVQYRLVGAATWTDIPGAASISFPRAWLTPPTISFREDYTAPIRHGLRWPVATRGQYEIRCRRLSEDVDPGVETDDQRADATWWTAIRRFANQDPIASPVPLAVTALRILATDQLNNVVDELSATCTSIAPHWDGSAWTEQATRNPGALLRHVLQGNGIATALPDSRLDLAGIQAFAAHCTASGYTFDMVRDFESSVWDLLVDIATAGRGTPSQRDGKWSVVWDVPKTVPVQHFTPRNSWGFEGSKAFADLPHALRVRFLNEEQGWQNDERIVYDDGYTAANATRYEAIELPGITASDIVWKHARFHFAQARLRPERWTLYADIEHTVCRRGDLVRVTHDVLVVGLGAGRVVDVVEDTNGDVAGVVIDEALEMDAGIDYGVSIRTPGDAAVTAQIVTVAGKQTELTFAAPIAAAKGVGVGDLLGFGELGAETVDALVLAIEPQQDFRAALHLVPYQEGVYTADTGTIPAFDTGITPIPGTTAPVVLSVRSDESALVRVGDTLDVRLEIEVRPLPSSLVRAGGYLRVQMRPTATGEPWRDADIADRRAGGVSIRRVREGETWDLQLRWIVPDRLPSQPAVISAYRIVGKSTPPAAPRNLTISVHGGSALLRWDPPTELDVRFGGRIQFRHSPAFTGATWASSTSIGQGANSTALVAVLPLKPGTYLARTVDTGGNPSSDVSAVTTKQAAVLEFANADAVAEHPTFVGVHDGTVEDGGVLKLDAAAPIDDEADFDAIPDLDALGGIVLSGTYDFAAGIYIAPTTEVAVPRVRLTAEIEAISVDETDLFDARLGPIDEWEDFDGDVQGAGDCQVWVRHTDDDPASTDAVWSAWNRLDSAEFEANGFEFQARLMTADPTYNVHVSTLGVRADILA